MLAIILVFLAGTIRLIGSNSNNVFSTVSSRLSSLPALGPRVMAFGSRLKQAHAKALKGCNNLVSPVERKSAVEACPRTL